LAVYGFLLAGLSYLTHYLAPALAKPTLITGLAGGALCLVWGVRAMQGSRGKAWAILTLIPVTFVMLSQAVLTWGGGTQQVPGRRMAAVVITVLCVFSVWMLMRIAYAGMVFDEQPGSPANAAGAKPQTTGKAEAEASASRKA
jgi:hypothetical protein